MCRLLAYAAPRPVTAQEVLGRDQSAVFQDMALLHRDGWGTVWLDAGGVHEHRDPQPHDAGDDAAAADDDADDSRTASAPVRLRRQASDRSGLGDAELTAALADDPATARLLHLRLATDGMVCSPQNTHPFVIDGLAFAHNGSLTPVERFEDLVAPELRGDIEGETDSERFFAAIRTRLLAGDGLREAVVATVAELRSRFPRASLNAILLTPTHLVAVHASESSGIPRVELAATGVPEADLPFESLSAYYLMRYRRDADGTTVFASSGLDVADWEPVPPESVAVVDLATLDLDVVPLSAAVGAEAK
ncbi:class II glutamine amidotransferase [Schumannella luteola]|uniref:Putative glutamine amidotransferase n=1 Tax=Schumannella luteola TaxID=472059 RepID=A0A852YL36_9MICO|nr:class II glutamine amidotransferase [Schumannella luteola]NYG97915.1 putative glutamine amidotransferase [Schumannella luteola]TPX03054.1 class II glutamine amidotransferase [Schumannella luteola]